MAKCPHRTQERGKSVILQGLSGPKEKSRQFWVAAPTEATFFIITDTGVQRRRVQRRRMDPDFRYFRTLPYNLALFYARVLRIPFHQKEKPVS